MELELEVLLKQDPRGRWGGGGGGRGASLKAQQVMLAVCWLSCTKLNYRKKLKALSMQVWLKKKSNDFWAGGNSKGHSQSGEEGEIARANSC